VFRQKNIIWIPEKQALAALLTMLNVKLCKSDLNHAAQDRDKNRQQ